MSKYIVTTTIYPPSKALEKFQTKKDWTLIVVGDKKTPHEYYRNNPDIIYLDPEYQETNYKELSDLIGWNCTSRRNIGYIEAIKRGADIIATIDDDNIPNDNWGENLFLRNNMETDCFSSLDTTLSVFDPLSATNYSYLWHRGYPIELVHRKNNIYKYKDTFNFGIQADFWNGDPDVDAIERMIYAPTCIFDDTCFPFTSDRISPFNSQNTFLTRESLKDYFMFPGTGRMEDIWAAYYCLSKGHKVIYNKATVTQERNPHNYIIDFNAEIIGYQNNTSLISDILQDPDNIQKYISSNSYKAFKLYQSYF